MKKTIITALLAAICICGQAKTYRSIKSPEVMACANVNPGKLAIQEVVMTDTATTIHFTLEYPQDHSFRFVKES